MTLWPRSNVCNVAVRVPLLLLGAIFVTESAIMTAFALTTGDERHPWLQVAVDSTVLTLTVAPVLYLFVVKPLRILAEERSRLLAHVFEIQDAERERLARDLHDEIGQSFTSLLVQLRVLEEAPSLDSAQAQAKALRDQSGQVYEQIRSLARGLHPTVLNDLGLVEAVRRMAEDFEAAHGVKTTVRASGTAERLERKVETAAFRIVQESLTNCAKHAQATQIDVSLTRDQNEMRVTIADNGRGFQVSKVIHGVQSGFGLTNMRERALLVGGSLTIDSRPGRGTTVRLRIPVRK